MIREAIAHIVAGATLSEDEAAAVMEEIMSGVATQAQMGAFLTALRLRPGGETVAEIAGLARIMREKAVQVHLAERVSAHALDTCGTGGDGAGTFNVSTATGILAAAAGASVAKHGNRSATSLCGSADVLEALGARIDLGPEQVAMGLEGHFADVPLLDAGIALLVEMDLDVVHPVEESREAAHLVLRRRPQGL